MKRALLLLTFIPLLFSCQNDDNGAVPETTVDFRFTHNWDGDNFESSDFDQMQYTNANGEQMSISKIVYLISDVTFTNTSTGIVYEAEDYNLVNVRENTNLTFTPNITIPQGIYDISFTFGFDDEDNIDGIYPDLNAANWNVPLPLGGGYHYMRLEGMFMDNSAAIQNYSYHTIRANDMSTDPITLQDTSFEVDLGSVIVGLDTEVEIKMNMAEWFKNPHQWDLNVLNSVLMPNFDAQIMMSENGMTVFSRGTVTQ